MDMAVTLEIADFPGKTAAEVEHMRFSQEPWEPGLFLVLVPSSEDWTSTAWTAG